MATSAGTRRDGGSFGRFPLSLYATLGQRLRGIDPTGFVAGDDRSGVAEPQPYLDRISAGQTELPDRICRHEIDRRTGQLRQRPICIRNRCPGVLSYYR